MGLNLVNRKVIAHTLARRLDMPEKQMVRVIDELFGKGGDGRALAKPGLVQKWVAYGYDVDISGCVRFTRGCLKARRFKLPNSDRVVDTPVRWRATARILRPFTDYVNDLAQAHMHEKAEDE